MTTFSSPSLGRGVSKTKDSTRSRRAQLTWFLSFLSLSTHCPHTDTVYVYVQGLGNGKRSTLCCSRAQHHGPQHGHLRWFVNFILESVLTEGAGMTRVRLLTVEEEEEEDEGGEEYLVQGVGAEVAASDTTYWCSVHRC